MKSFTCKWRRGGWGLCALVLGSYSSLASGNTIQENYGPFQVNFLTGTAVTGRLAGFNPALGTLESVGFTYDSTAVLLEGLAVSSRIKIDDASGTRLTSILFPSMLGRAEQEETGSFSVPTAELANFETAGTVDVTLMPFTACRGTANTPTGCIGFLGRVDGQVTYTYTPASTPTNAPEPEGIPMLLSGGIAIAWAASRSLARGHNRIPLP